MDVDTDTSPRPQNALTDEQKAAVFGSSTASGRQTSPKTKHRAVCFAHTQTCVWEHETRDLLFSLHADDVMGLLCVMSLHTHTASYVLLILVIHIVCPLTLCRRRRRNFIHCIHL